METPFAGPPAPTPFAFTRHRVVSPLWRAELRAGSVTLQCGAMLGDACVPEAVQKF